MTARITSSLTKDTPMTACHPDHSDCGSTKYDRDVIGAQQSRVELRLKSQRLKMLVRLNAENKVVDIKDLSVRCCTQPYRDL
jgi:hypothetical protein